MNVGQSGGTAWSPSLSHSETPQLIPQECDEQTEKGVNERELGGGGEFQRKNNK